MTEDAARFFLNQMLDSLEYMHKQGVAHRDLKPENILIDKRLNLKIADFGLATNKDIDNLTEYAGTSTYMAPEIIEGKKYKGSEVDIFSIAVILFALVNGLVPFRSAKLSDPNYNCLVKGQVRRYFKVI